MGQWVGVGQIINKEASWLYAELKSHISFQVSFVAYLKLSGETWNEMCYLKLFETFQTYHGGLLIWNFQMRLEMRCAIWNFWNLKLFNLSQELLIWNFQMRLKMRYAIWNFLKLETFNPSQGLLIWNFQMRLETRCAIWNFLSFSTYHRGCLFQTFRWDLKGDMLFETWNCLTMSWELLIWNFQMRLTKRCDIQNLWNFWNFKLFKLFKPIKGVAYLKLLNET